MTHGAFTWGEYRALERAIASAGRGAAQNPGPLGRFQVEFTPSEFAAGPDGSEVSITGRPRAETTNILVAEAEVDGFETRIRVSVTGGGSLFDGVVSARGLERLVLPAAAEVVEDGMRTTVAWLRAMGYATSTSDLFSLRGFPLIVVVLDAPDEALPAAREIGSELSARGIPVGALGARDAAVCVSAVFDFGANTSIVEIVGLDDGMLVDPAALRQVEVTINIAVERWTVVGRYRPNPRRLDVHGAIRTSDGMAIDADDAAEFLASYAGAEDDLIAAAEAAWRR